MMKQQVTQIRSAGVAVLAVEDGASNLGVSAGSLPLRNWEGIVFIVWMGNPEAGIELDDSADLQTGPLGATDEEFRTVLVVEKDPFTTAFSANVQLAQLDQVVRFRPRVSNSSGDARSLSSTTLAIGSPKYVGAEFNPYEFID